LPSWLDHGTHLLIVAEPKPAASVASLSGRAQASALARSEGWTERL
jgi:hypothetical protein